MASFEAINSGDVRWTPARHGHRCQRPKRSHDKSRYESLEDGFDGKNIRAENIRTIGTRRGHRYF